MPPPPLCRAQIIASDGGYRASTTPWPAGGLFVAVAERYEVCHGNDRVVGAAQPSAVTKALSHLDVTSRKRLLLQVVCDFRQLGGSKLYVVNDFDDKRMKDVAMFCYSHLVMKLDIQKTPGCDVLVRARAAAVASAYPPPRRVHCGAAQHAPS